MHATTSLDAALALLVAYGNWASPRRRPEVCGSAEGAYRSAPAGASSGLPGDTDLATLLRVQHVLKSVPIQQRHVLQAEFIAEGRRARAVKGLLGLTWRQWRSERDEGVQAFAAAWREHCARPLMQSGKASLHQGPSTPRAGKRVLAAT